MLPDQIETINTSPNMTIIEWSDGSMFYAFTYRWKNSTYNSYIWYSLRLRLFWFRREVARPCSHINSKNLFRSAILWCFLFYSAVKWWIHVSFIVMYQLDIVFTGVFNEVDKSLYSQAIRWDSEFKWRMHVSFIVTYRLKTLLEFIKY